MPQVQMDGVGIYYESHGTGFPLVLTPIILMTEDRR